MSNYKDTWHSPRGGFIQLPNSKNKNNDCKDFQTMPYEKTHYIEKENIKKWWEIWK